MSAQREHVDSQRTNIHGHSPGGLHGVGVHGDASLAPYRRDFFYGLHHAGFVIGVHDRNQDGFRSQRAAHIRRIDYSIPAHAQPGHRNSFALQLRAGVQDRRVLDSTCDHVPFGGTGGADRTQNREIIGFGPAAGKHDFFGIAAQQHCHLAARCFEPLPCSLPEIVDTGRIAVHFAQIPRQFAQHFGRNRRSRVVIEVNMGH